MEAEDNVSTVTQFALLRFSNLPNLQALLSGVFSIIYIIILTGNSLTIILSRLDPALQKPMYFFLANFFSLEICYVSVTLPRILVNLWTQDRRIFVPDCATQMCFFLILGATECLLLAVTAYDRCVAGCGPLHYPLVMTPKLCLQLAVGAWVSGIPVQIGQTCQIFSLHVCHFSEINHFSCDIPLPPHSEAGLWRHFCTRAVSLCSSSVVCGRPFLLILASYSQVIPTILRLPIARGQAKAFSTRSSHLLVVVLFFRSAAITDSRPKSSHSAGTDRLLSLFHTIVTPMFNPMICSLQNKDVITALRKLLLKK